MKRLLPVALIIMHINVGFMESYSISQSEIERRYKKLSSREKKDEIEILNIKSSNRSLEEMAEAICKVLDGSEFHLPKLLLLETAAAETALGKIKDRTWGAGMGITQIDKKTFYWVRKSTSKEYVDLIKKHFKVDIKRIKWSTLRKDKFLSLLFARLYYKKFPNSIPNDLNERAMYYKELYNTHKGKGSPEHYIMMSKAHLYTS